MQHLLKTKHVLVGRDRTESEGPISLRTVRQLGSLEAPVTVVDSSIETEDGHALRSSTLVDLMSNLNKKDAKPVRVLPIGLLYDPFQSVPGECQPYASEQWAWEEVKGNSYCEFNRAYPLPQMRWGTVSTCGAYEPWKMAGGGRGTVVQVDKGTLLCFMLVPIKGGPSVHDRAFLYFDGDEPDPDTFDVELVCLRTGDQLLMRPNQVYRLITAEDTVSRAGHYYATAALADTVAGLYHEFVGGWSISKDDDHETSIAMLTHLITLYHRNLTQTAKRALREYPFPQHSDDANRLHKLSVTWIMFPT
ncbi:hypothetical protein H0H93_010066 [Arthromyces matolae]|nr:hypothetical protein H0H93_010066 [Arthromyces matolae]